MTTLNNNRNLGAFICRAIVILQRQRNSVNRCSLCSLPRMRDKLSFVMSFDFVTHVWQLKRLFFKIPVETNTNPYIIVLFQVQPADETFNDFEDWVAVSPVLTLEPQDITFSKPVTITIPTPVYSPGGDNVDIQPSLRLLSCEPRDNRKSMSHAPTYQWHDITDTTPLSVVNECATFTTSHPAR